MLMEVNVSAVEGVTAQDMITAAKNLTSDGSSTVTVEQSWNVGFEVPADANASELAASLEAKCRETSPDCTLTIETSAARRRASAATPSAEPPPLPPVATPLPATSSGSLFSRLCSWLREVASAAWRGVGGAWPSPPSSGRRALLQSQTGSNGTTTVVLVRQLISGHLTAKIPGFNSSGVSLTSEELDKVDVQLTVTQAGGANEAAALLDGSLSQEQVQA